MTGTRPTVTPTPARISFAFATGQNQWQCAFDLAFSKLQSGATRSFTNLVISNPQQLRDLFRVIYVSPGMGAVDYSDMRTMSRPGGSIDEFVLRGGVAVINAGGLTADQIDIAPRGVDFTTGTTHNSVTIAAPAHPFFNGADYGGATLQASQFANWQPTDYGVLGDVPEDATVLLRNADGPAMIEYNHGLGRVIVSSLAFCWDGRAATQGPPSTNLLLYSNFFAGFAGTPGPTVTATPTPTVTQTFTPSATSRFSLTPTATPTRTATATRTPRRGDFNGDGKIDELDVRRLIDAIFEPFRPSGTDLNGDGSTTAADVTELTYRLD
jgi:hypothetical protein